MKDIKKLHKSLVRLNILKEYMINNKFRIEPYMVDDICELIDKIMKDIKKYKESTNF